MQLFKLFLVLFVFVLSNVQAELMPSNNVKVVILVPQSHGNAIREVVGKMGVGKFGDYDFCSVSTTVKGYWRAQEGANPAVGDIGTMESSIEEKVEFVCPKDLLQAVIEAAKKVHPYETMGYDIYPLLELK
jgi:hypothetical protein